MDVTRVQFACGAFAVALPLLLVAGYYSQLLLDRLNEARDDLVVVIVTAAALIGEAAALTGLVRPNRVLAALAGLGTAISATGVVLVLVYRVRLWSRRRGPH